MRSLLPDRTHIIACCMFALLLAGCSEPPSLPKNPIPVVVGKAEAADLTSTVSYTGTIRARWQADLGFRVAGKIVERRVDVGDRVKKGTLLARLDPTDYESQIRGDAADVSAAKANLVQARADLDRTSVLVKDGWATPQLLDSRRSAVDQGIGRLDGAEAKLKLARDNLTYTYLYAEEDGIIITIPTEVGQVLAVGQPALSLARSAELEAAVSVPEGRTTFLQSAEATVVMWSNAGEGASYAARLRELAASADTATRTFSTRFSITNPGPDVKIGATAIVNLRGRDNDTGVVPVSVPSTSIFQHNNKPAVWRIENGTLALVAVQLIQFRQTRAFVTGLEPGATIVTAGVHKLNEKARIKVVEAKP